MRCVLYTREAAVQQQKGKGAVNEQLASVRKYARAKSWQVVAVFADTGASASDMTRPQLQKMLRLCNRRKGIDIVLVQRTDRIARRLSDLVDFKLELLRTGVRLATVEKERLPLGLLKLGRCAIPSKNHR
jgi:DNA invertase Pin-like site-specific DNA recombinase